MQNKYLVTLSEILNELTKSHKQNGQTVETLEECQHPASVATYWISKWVDYSDKFGFGKSAYFQPVSVLSNIVLPIRI